MDYSTRIESHKFDGVARLAQVVVSGPWQEGVSKLLREKEAEAPRKAARMPLGRS